MSCSTKETRPAHLSPAELAGYLDRRVSQAGRSRVEAHLATCESCLDDLISAARVLRAQQFRVGATSSRMRWTVNAGWV